MSEPSNGKERKVVPGLPGNGDQQVEVIFAAGAVAIPFVYSAWVSATGYPFIIGAWLFVEGLWIVVVLLWLASWDLGAWLSDAPPLHDPVSALVAPRWLVNRLSSEWRDRMRAFFDRYIHLVALLVGLLIGHAYWH